MKYFPILSQGGAEMHPLFHLQASYPNMRITYKYMDLRGGGGFGMMLPIWTTHS